MATPPVFSAGAVLTAAQMNAVGMWLIKTDTITSGSSKEITAVFSTDYNNYLIILDNIVTSGGVAITMQMGSTGGSAYYWAGVTTNYSTNVVAGENGNATSSFATGAVADTSGTASSVVNLQRPFLTTRTTYTAAGVDSRTGGAGARNYSGFLNNTTSYTSFTLSAGAQTFTSCNVSVYGYRK